MWIYTNKLVQVLDLCTLSFKPIVASITSNLITCRLGAKTSGNIIPLGVDGSLIDIFLGVVGLGNHGTCMPY